MLERSVFRFLPYVASARPKRAMTQFGKTLQKLNSRNFSIVDRTNRVPCSVLQLLLPPKLYFTSFKRRRKAERIRSAPPHRKPELQPPRAALSREAQHNDGSEPSPKPSAPTFGNTYCYIVLIYLSLFRVPSFSVLNPKQCCRRSRKPIHHKY